MTSPIVYRISLYTLLVVGGVVLWFFLSFMLLVLIFLGSILSLVALGCILFSIGALAPGGHIAKMYAIIIIFPLAFLLWYTLFVLVIRFDQFELMFDLFENNGEGIAVVMSLIISLLISVVVVRTMLAKKAKISSDYIAVVMTALGFSSVIILLPAILLPRTPLLSDFYFGFYYYLLIAWVPLMISGLGTILISTIRRPYQHIVVGILAMCVLITIVWTIWGPWEEIIDVFSYPDP